MLKSKKYTKGAVALASIMTMCVLMKGGTVIYATAPANGTTPVTYDNRTVLPDGNGQYGMIIPTAISFSDTSKTANADIEITGIEGYNLDTDWTTLQVAASVQSTNGYKLKHEAKEVTYQLSMDKNTSVFDSTMADGKATAANAVTQTLGVGTGEVKKVSGTAILTGAAASKGTYTDTLTYSFKENKNTPK